MKDVFIAGMARTPVGAFNGALSGVSAVKLGGSAIGAAVKKTGLSPFDVEEVIMGNIFSCGLGPLPARQAALGAGLEGSVRAALLNCGLVSGLSAVIFAAGAITAGSAEVVVAGGMESLSRVPYMVEKARFGIRLGNSELTDPLMKDCLWDERYESHVAAGVEKTARRMKITRAEQDRYARQSYSRAIEAQRLGYLDEEVMPITLPMGRDRFASLNTDEGPQNFDPDGLASRQPFVPEGTITPGNASFLADGAAALVLVSSGALKRFGLTPLARVSACFSIGAAPEMFSVAAAGAVDGLLNKAGLGRDDVDLFEINEDFSASTLAVIASSGLNESRVNVNGGAVAIGNPGGAAGTRLLVSLVTSMRRTGARRGVAAIGSPGAEGAALLVEAIERR